MKNTKLYVHYYGKSFFYNKGVTLSVREVDVIETEQQYRTVSGKPELVDRQKIDKSRTEKIVNEFGRYYWISRKSDLSEFKRLIMNAIDRQIDEMKNKMFIYKAKKQAIAEEFKREGVV